ncbi:enoyl-CoA hydratase/isomerase family protein, partial [Neptuniibacter sp.]|uniref:enoyl-CoA hydratase/isomerase family protein n=1 Tax=Neptuniibacter sp. TaxID=1962643 RepID=UPI0026292441
MTDLVLYNSHAGVAEIVFNRPQKRNAITLEMYQKATSFLKTAQADEQVKAVLFYGEGDSFCAGNDIQDFVSSIGDSDGLQYVIGFLHEL